MCLHLVVKFVQDFLETAPLLPTTGGLLAPGLLIFSAFALAFAWLTDFLLTPALCARLRIATLWDLLSIDLGKDPHGMHNVADDPDYAAVRRRLCERLMSILRETGDPRVTGGGTTFDEPPYASPVPRRKK